MKKNYILLLVFLFMVETQGSAEFSEGVVATADSLGLQPRQYKNLIDINGQVFIDSQVARALALDMSFVNYMDMMNIIIPTDQEARDAKDYRLSAMLDYQSEEIKCDDASMALALQLQEEEVARRRPYAKSIILPNSVTDEDKLKMTELAQAFLIRAQGQDVHQANGQFLVANWRGIMKPIIDSSIANEFEKYKNLTFEDFSKILEGISKLQGIDESLLGHFNAGMGKISGYWGNADGEVGETTQNLCAYTVTIYHMMGQHENLLHTLYNSIAENTATAGGCHPGVNGRFIAYIMTTFLNMVVNSGQIEGPKKN